MTWPIDVVLIAGSLTAVLGAIRILLAITTTAWYTARYDEVDSLHPFDCAKFHEIQNRPKPLGVRVNDWLEAHHI